MSPLTDGTTQQNAPDASTHSPPCQVKFYKWWPESRAGSGFGPFGRLIRTSPVGDAEFRRVPLDPSSAWAGPLMSQPFDGGWPSLSSFQSSRVPRSCRVFCDRAGILISMS